MEVVMLRPTEMAVVYDIMKDHLRLTKEEHLIDDALEEVRLDLLTTHTHLFYGLKDGRVVSYILFFELDGAFGEEVYLKQVHSIEPDTLHSVYLAVREYAKQIGAMRVWGESEVPHKILIGALTGDPDCPSTHSDGKFLWDDLMSEIRTP